jgi:hypothetical protein
MKFIENTNIGIVEYNDSMIYIKGDYTEYLLKWENCLIHTAPIEFINMKIEDLDENGMFLVKGYNWFIELDGFYLDQKILDKWEAEN